MSYPMMGHGCGSFNIGTRRLGVIVGSSNGFTVVRIMSEMEKNYKTVIHWSAGKAGFRKTFVRQFHNVIPFRT